MNMPSYLSINISHLLLLQAPQHDIGYARFYMIWFFFLKIHNWILHVFLAFFFTILCFEVTYLSVCKLDFKRKKYHVTYMYHRIYNQKLTVVNEYATEWYRIIWRTNEANRLSYLQPMHLNMSIGTYKFEF